KDEESGRRSASATWRDVDDDRDRRSKDLLHDFTHGGFKTARCAQVDEHGVRVTCVGGVDAARDVFSADGLDGVVDDQMNDLSAGELNESKKDQSYCETTNCGSHESPLLAKD